MRDLNRMLCLFSAVLLAGSGLADNPVFAELRWSFDEPPGDSLVGDAEIAMIGPRPMDTVGNCQKCGISQGCG